MESYEVLHPTHSIECVDCQGFGQSNDGIKCHRCDGTGLEPMSLEPMSLERAILDEQDRAEQRAIQEVEDAAPLAVSPCAHHDLIVRAGYSSPFDDHQTFKGWCPSPGCGWIVLTEYVNGCSEARPMTPAEIEVFAAYERRYAEAEWLLDHQEGVR